MNYKEKILNVSIKCKKKKLRILQTDSQNEIMILLLIDLSKWKI